MILLAAIVCGQKMIGCVYVAYGDELCGVPLGKWDELPGLNQGVNFPVQGRERGQDG